MARRWLTMAFIGLACATAWAGSSSQATGPALVPLDATLAFTSLQGRPPAPQVLTIHEDLEEERLAVHYAGAAGWLRTAVSRTEAARSLTVQPTPFALGPGVYGAVIDLGDAARPPARVGVTLAVLASSRAACPPRSTLRYEGGGDGRGEPADFGKTFFATYCLSCHASARVGDARSGAPRGLDWDVPPVVRAQLYAIDAEAARGPAGSHDDMPPASEPRRPSDAERALLGRWIACGAP